MKMELRTFMIHFECMMDTQTECHSLLFKKINWCHSVYCIVMSVRFKVRAKHTHITWDHCQGFPRLLSRDYWSLSLRTPKETFHLLLGHRRMTLWPTNLYINGPWNILSWVMLDKTCVPYIISFTKSFVEFIFPCPSRNIIFQRLIVCEIYFIPSPL
jgi:hypothetical protein